MKSFLAQVPDILGILVERENLTSVDAQTVRDNETNPNYFIVTAINLKYLNLNVKKDKDNIYGALLGQASRTIEACEKDRSAITTDPKYSIGLPDFGDEKGNKVLCHTPVLLPLPTGVAAALVLADIAKTMVQMYIQLPPETKKDPAKQNSLIHGISFITSAAQPVLNSVITAHTPDFDFLGHCFSDLTIHPDSNMNKL